jgi:hypothetical protein
MESLCDPAAMPLRLCRQERFAQMRSLGLPSLEAAREAGYAAMSPENARKLANKPHVLARVAYLCRRDAEAFDERRAILAERQWLIHESDIADYYEDAEEPGLDAKGNVIHDAQGKPVTRIVQRVKPFSALTREQRMVIDGLTFTEHGTPNLKLASKVEANRELRKLYGLDAAPKRAEEGGMGVGIGGAIIQVITGVSRAPNDPPVTIEQGR